MSFVDDGERCSMYFLQARTQEDLRRRTRAHKMIADMTHGLFGRSPDHFASSVTAMAIDAAVFNVGPRPYAENLVNYYQHIRRSDNYVAYAVLPPQAARDPTFYQRQNLPGPSLEVVREDDDGIGNGQRQCQTGLIAHVKIGSPFTAAKPSRRVGVQHEKFGQGFDEFASVPGYRPIRSPIRAKAHAWSGLRPPGDNINALERHHRLLGLIENFNERGDRSAIRLGFRGCGLEHSHAHRQAVTGMHRP
jgi:hypothetical protein